MAVTTEAFLSGADAPYIADLYRRFAEDPSSIDPSWASFFAELHEDARVVLSEARGASWSRVPSPDNTGTTPVAIAPRPGLTGAQRPSLTDSRGAIIDSVRAL